MMVTHNHAPSLCTCIHITHEFTQTDMWPSAALRHQVWRMVLRRLVSVFILTDLHMPLRSNHIYKPIPRELHDLIISLQHHMAYHPGTAVLTRQ